MTSKYYKGWKSWRDRVIDSIYYIMGEKCVVCGYNKCRRALHFHHIDPKTKSFDIGQISNSYIRWDNLEDELKKCTVLCANCHAEIHDKEILPNLKTTFSDEKLFEVLGTCKHCNKPLKSIKRQFCDAKCKGKYNRKQQLEKNILKKTKSIWSVMELRDIVDLLELHDGVMYKAAKELNLSDNGLRKRFKKLTEFNNYHEYNLAKQLGMI